MVDPKVKWARGTPFLSPGDVQTLAGVFPGLPWGEAAGQPNEGWCQDHQFTAGETEAQRASAVHASCRKSVAHDRA